MLPLAKLQKLHSLNLSVTAVRDVTPLENCEALRRCWLNCCWNLPYEEAEALAANAPDCLISLASASPTSGGWREDDIYFEMRDAFNAPYMKGDVSPDNFLNKK